MSDRDGDEVGNQPAEDAAHDLNNILQALVMHLAFAIDQLPPDHPARPDLDEVREHASRARLLSERLLDRIDARDVSGVWSPGTQEKEADWDETSFDGAPPASARLLVAEDDAAIRNAVARAGATTRHLDWFEVTEIRGQLDDGGIAHVQVGLKIGFRLEDA